MVIKMIDLKLRTKMIQREFQPIERIKRFAVNYIKFSCEGDFMPLSPELLEILVCPKCRSKVELKTDQSGLACVNPECRLVYPIRDEIPVMLIEEARAEGELKIKN
jgi:uncharacterized protein YbaR (Trm112 family)